jgi:hypothetical protein
MKNQKKYILLLMSILLCMGSLRAQDNTRDVVFLKNGSIVKGSLLETIPGASIKIQTADGSIFVYAMAEIVKIEKETVVSARPAISSSIVSGQDTSDRSKTTFSIYGGVALPTGDFAKQGELGYAETGFTIGIQIVGAGQVSFLVDASYASNPNNIGELSSFGGNASTSSWGSLLMLTGLKIGTTNPIGANFFFAPVFGINIGTSPKVDFTYSITNYQTYPYETTTVTAKFSSATSTTIAYGMMMGVTIGRVTLGARYVASKSKYKVSAEASIVSGQYSAQATGTGTLEQNTSIIQVYLGIIL